SMFGKSPEDMNADELAIVTAGVSRFARSGNHPAESLAGRLSELMRSKDSKYLYNQYSDKTPRYISLKTIGLCSDYRYYFDDTRKTATLTSGSNVCIFQTGSDTLERGGNKEKLKYETVMSKYPYISEDDASAIFDCHSEYVVQSDYAVCLTGAMDSKAKELLEKLTGGSE
ncbi:MAG: hypothetical protein K6G42_09715, partial [Lachnospiraceae bacterium]|nr:hypothetical protein [Lachnospiraceae bacterium]